MYEVGSRQQLQAIVRVRLCSRAAGVSQAGERPGVEGERSVTAFLHMPLPAHESRRAPCSIDCRGCEGKVKAAGTREDVQTESQV